MTDRIEFTINGRSVAVDTDGSKPLLSVLREDLGLRGSKFGCGTEQCGACMVLIDGAPEHSCSREIATVAGRRITTVEGLSSNGALHPLQQAFLDEQAGQCGYCLSGILISAAALLAQKQQAAPRRDRRRSRSPSVPLRHPQPRHPRRAEGRRRHERRTPMIASTLPHSLIDNPLLSQWIAFEEKRPRARRRPARSRSARAS